MFLPRGWLLLPIHRRTISIPSRYFGVSPLPRPHPSVKNTSCLLESGKGRAAAAVTARFFGRNDVPLQRTFATKTRVDEIVDGIAEQYSIAKDEFEIATEESQKATIYAASDRATAREELQKLETLYQDSISLTSADEAAEIKKRVWHRLRELRNAVERLNDDHDE